MGKQVKGWVPPEEDQIIEEKTSGWIPPDDDVIIEPVKKKDDPDPVIPSVGISASAEVGKPSAESTAKPTPTTRHIGRINNQVIVTKNAFNQEAEAKRAELQAIIDADPSKEEQVNADFKTFLAEREAVHNATMDKWINLYSEQFEKEEAEFQKEAAKAEFQENKITNPLTSLKTSVWSTFSKDLPSAAFGARALGRSTVKKIDEKAIEGMEALGVKPVGQETGAKIEEMFTDAVKLFTGSDGKASAGMTRKDAENKLIIDDIKSSINRSTASANDKKFLIDSLDKVKDGDFVDWVNYAASAVGTGIGQIPTSVATKGASSLVQQMGNIYVDSVQKIAQEQGLTIDEVIKQGKDDVLYPLVFGIGTGLLDAIGAKGVAGAVSKKQVMDSFRGRALSVLKAGGKGAAVESGTEAAQGALEQIGIGKAAGKTWEQTLKEFKWDQVVEGALQGGIAGLFLGSGGRALSNTFDRITAKKIDVPTVVAEVKADIVPTNEASVEAAAAKIEKAIEDAPPTGVEPVADTGSVTPTADPAPDTSVSQIKPSPVTATDENSGRYNFGKDDPIIPDADTTGLEGHDEISGQPRTQETTGGEEQGVPPVVEKQPGDTAVPTGDGNVEPGSGDVQPVPDSEGLQKSSEADKVDDGTSVIERIEKLDPYESQGYQLTQNTATKKLMLDMPERAKVAFDIMDFAKKVWPKDLTADMEKHPLAHVGQFFYGDANSVREWVDMQIKGERQDIESRQKTIDSLQAKPKQTKADKDSIAMWQESITRAESRIQEYKDALAKEQPTSETPQQIANRELDALAASGDISRDGKKVTILTEKGGREAKRIHEELQNSKRTGIQKNETGDSDRQGAPPDGEGDQVQPIIGESVPGSEKPVADGRSGGVPTGTDIGSEKQQDKPVAIDASKEQGSEDGGGNVSTDQAPAAEGGVPTDTPPPTDSVALDDADSEKNLSGIKKALVPEDKVEDTPIERRGTEDMLQRAKADVDNGRINPKAIVDEIAKGNARSLQPGEVAALVYYKAKLDQKSDSLNQELIDAIDSKDVEAQNRIRVHLDVLNQEIDNYHTMSLKTAYEQSLAFRLRQMLLDNEYNLASQILKYKAANNGVIPAEVEAKFKELDEQLKAANARIKALEESNAKLAASEAMQAIQADLKRQQERRLKSAQARKQKINQFFDSLKVKSDPNKLNNVFQVVGEGVYNGAIEAMRVAVLAGSDVATVIQAGVDYINEHYRGTDFKPGDFENEVKPGIEKIIPSDEDSLPSATVTEDGQLRIPAKLIKMFAEEAENIEELTQRLHAIIKQDFPDITLREVRDAITQYGKTKALSKDELDTKLREMKRIGRLISSLEDVQDQKRPKRSGLQRDKPTDEERRLMKQVKEAMKDLPIDEAEMERNWRTALDAVKARLNNQIADLKNQIETGEKTPRKKGIEYDQEANELKAERDALREIIQRIEGKPKMSDEQKIRMAISAVEKNIAELERRISAKDVSPSQKSSAPVTPELKALRDRRNQLAETYKQMQDELGATEKKRLELHKKALQKAIDRFQERIKTGDFLPPKKKPVAPDAEAIKLKLERDKIKFQFDVLQEKVKYANRPMSEKIWDGIVDIWNLPKSFVASIDMSAVFRQGFVLAVANPTAGVKSFTEMFRQAFSQEKANEWLLRLRETDAYAVMKASKLYLAEPTTKHTAKEEQFMSNLAGKIPVLGPAIKASERAYTGFLNKLRADVFANGADRLREQGITPESNPEAYKSLANFINNATGRGNLGGAEMAAPLLNALFFSPRYVMSRINLLNPVTYAKMPAPVRKMALKSVASYVGFNVMLLVLIDAAFDDVEVEWDPRSSDFGKLRLGDTRYDPWAGFQQVVRFVAQLITGERKSTKTKEISKIDGTKFPFETRGDLASRFLRSKLSPTAGTIVNLLEGENLIGEEATPQTELAKNVIPLYLQDMQGIYEENGATGVARTFIPAFFGIGVQSYGEKSGLNTPVVDPEGMVGALNKKHKYSISQVDRRDLAKSLEQDVTDEMHAKYQEIKDREIKRLFDRYHFRLKDIDDRDIYDKSMDAIVKEADRKAKYDIARENKWDTEKFKEGNKFFLRSYVKRDGKVEARASLFRN